METNIDTSTDKDLNAAADTLMRAAMDYWKAYRKARGSAAVVWVKDTDGRMVILTRGEYQATLMRNIDALRNEQDSTYLFDA